MKHAARACFGLLLILTDATGFRSVKRDQSESATGVEDGTGVTLFERRRRDRRRRYIPPAPTPPPAPPSCAYQWVWNSDANSCCNTRVQGSWAFSRSIASVETIQISYGYFINYSSFDLDVTYSTSMISARAGFSFMGFGGGASYDGYTADLVVSQTYINVAVNFNMSWTATYVNDDGAYLYQWKWDVLFGPSTACTQAPRAQILTSKIVQADSVPKCLPGTNVNADPQYQTCEDVAPANPTPVPSPPPRRRSPPRRRAAPPRRRAAPPRRRRAALPPCSGVIGEIGAKKVACNPNIISPIGGEPVLEKIEK